MRFVTAHAPTAWGWPGANNRPVSIYDQGVGETNSV